MMACHKRCLEYPSSAHNNMPRRTSSTMIMAYSLVGLLLILLFTARHGSDAFTPSRMRTESLSVSSLSSSALFGDQESQSSTSNSTTSVATAVVSKDLQWQVYVDQSKSSIEKGSSATLDALISLAPPKYVQVIPAVLPKSKIKGPLVRCLSLQQPPTHMDIGNVDSVEKVYRLLTKHMKVKDVSLQLCECLKWKYKGNGYLDSGKISRAIDCYNQALTIPIASPAQQGLILLMRSRAYLQSANSNHQRSLRDTVNGLLKSVPNLEQVQSTMIESSPNPALAQSVLTQIYQETLRQEHEFRQTQYHHSMYQFNLLLSLQDALKGTELLPKYAMCWRQAGDILGELWKLKESTQYYERAMELDPSLQAILKPVIRRIQKRKDLLDSARAYGWSEDTLRLALDVAG